MQPEPFRPPRKRRVVQPVIEMTEPASITEAAPIVEESTDALPMVIDTTGVALDESGQPLPPPPEPEAPRTDFYFPPLPRTPAGKSETPTPGTPQAPPRQSQVWASLKA